MVLSNENAKTLLKIDPSDEPTHYLKFNSGNWLAQSSFSTVLRWLSTVRFFFQNESFDLCLLSPIKLMVRQFYEMKKSYNRDIPIDGILIDKSPKQYEKNYQNEMVTATIVVPQWKNVFSIKYFSNTLEDLPLGKIRMRGIYPIFFVNRLRPYAVEIESLENKYNFSEIESHITTSIPQIHQICSSCNYSLFSDLYSEQQQSRFLGATLVLHGKIVSTRPFLIIQNPKTKNFVRLYPTEKLQKFMKTDSYGLSEYEGQLVKTLGFFWYRFGSNVPEFPEAISIEILSKSEASFFFEEKLDLPEKYNKPLPLFELPTVLTLQDFQLEKLVGYLKRNYNLFQTFIELSKVADSKAQVKISGMENRQLRIDGRRLEWFGLLNIYHSKSKWSVQITEKGKRILYDLLKDKTTNRLLEYLDILYVASISKIKEELSKSGFYVPDFVLKPIINDLKSKKIVFQPKTIRNEAFPFFKLFITKKPIAEIEFSLEEYLSKLESAVLSLFCSIRHGFTWSKLLEYLDVIEPKLDDQLISSLLIEDLKIVCTILLDKGELIMNGNCMVYPYEKRVLNLFQNNPNLFLTKSTISDSCSIPIYELSEHLEKLIDSKLISMIDEYYCLTIDPIKDKIRKKQFVTSWTEKKIISLLEKKGRLSKSELINEITNLLFAYAKKMNLNSSRLEIAYTAINNLKDKKTIIIKKDVIYLVNSKIGDVIG